ncbi:Eco57I restriction-modification methylase domain-containing protein [Flagellimonas meridianipacifica]|uniref:site-specific DNA-methyltransferase (adenine-specific) n=1 Tax=Flagellimonas meridianipacifica TaxID=1080225 RepID=A0A2T0MIF2_9FLAO|nr:N-6 DNA methylase [Allomuricauda pacifica]PRX57367.1 type I restriction-modification system DNA methylase subunit [Allomuricauda pacifica]
MTIDKSILSFLKNYSYDVEQINRLITSAFCKENDLVNTKNQLIRNLLINDSNRKEILALDNLCKLFEKTKQAFNFECLIELFEFVISPNDKIVNGAVYTPKYIRQFIVQEALGKAEKPKSATACDVACGCGGFLYEYALLLHRNTNKSLTGIIRENLYGIDITEYSIERTKILLSLLAISNGEDRQEYHFNLYVGDSLEFDWFEVDDNIKNNGGFQYVFSNPPYVGSSNLDDQTKKLMANWSVASTGKLDLYIPFFEIGLKWLRDGGILGYITVNNFYRSLNGRGLRKYFSENEFHFQLIDFGGSQVFKSRLTYTCICLITKQTGGIQYTRSLPTEIKSLDSKDYIPLEYADLNDFEGWHLDDLNTKLNISKLENTGQKLGDLFPIRNGFATLRNKIYLINPIREDEDFYYFEKNETRYQIEREVCKEAIKPNILKKEDDIPRFKEKLIFPYTYLDRQNDNLFEESTNRYVKPIDEPTFRRRFPFAYRYLNSQKEELAKRDKGKREYETWFAFGRSQALYISGIKLLFPYISDAPYFVLTEDEDLLFYNGYALVSDSQDDLLFIKRLLMTRIFWYYIRHTSKPYTNDYYALAKNYIKNFSVPHFTDAEKNRIMAYRNKKSLENFLLKKYNITDIDFTS